jgi:hypothetical protein
VGDDWSQLARELCADPRFGAVHRIAVRQGFVLTYAQARAAGLSPSTIRTQVSSGRWSAPRRGILSIVAEPTHQAQAVLSASAAVLSRPGSTISHHSAALVRGIELFERPDAPHVIASVSPGLRNGVVLHRAALPHGHVSEWFGVGVTSVERTVLDLARADRRQGIVAADSAVRGLTTRERLLAISAECARWPGIAAARGVLELANPKSESPLESLTKLLVLDAGLPMPELQWPVSGGDWYYRLDLCWPEQRLVLEADGLLKYASADVLRDEKRRQVRLSRAGFHVERVMWADVVHRPRATAARIASLLGYVGAPSRVAI